MNANSSYILSYLTDTVKKEGYKIVFPVAY